MRFDVLILEFIFYFYIFLLFERKKYMMIYIIGVLYNFDGFAN